MFFFHLQLILHDWFEEQTRTGQRFSVPVPDFAEHIRTFERQNNLSWVPSVSNALALHALRLQPRADNALPAPRGSGVARETGTPRPAPAELSTRVRNPSRDARFTGRTAFATNVRERRVDEAIVVGGGREAMPKLTRNGVAGLLCISYHAKGTCFENCRRSASHNPLSVPEAQAFHTWCDVVFA
jgi:hypothetical protein